MVVFNRPFKALMVLTLLRPSLIFFFFQAEDGIRDLTVTGVQTCALPISTASSAWSAVDVACCFSPTTFGLAHASLISCGLCSAKAACLTAGNMVITRASRSEERRVGKECRSRWSVDHLKKK